MEPMAPSSAQPRPHHAGSPFRAEPEPIAEEFVVGDRVCHDSHGMGKVIGVDPTGVLVDFGTAKIRVVKPCRKMTTL